MADTNKTNSTAEIRNKPCEMEIAPLVALLKTIPMLTVKLAAWIFLLGMLWASHETEKQAMSTELFS